MSGWWWACSGRISKAAQETNFLIASEVFNRKMGLDTCSNATLVDGDYLSWGYW
jgi:hypothetical protein